MTYALSIVDNDTTVGVNAIKQLATAQTGRIVWKVWFKFVPGSGTPSNWGFVLVNDPTNDVRIVGVVLYYGGNAQDVAIYDYAGGTYVVTKTLPFDPHDGNWHLAVLELDTGTGEFWASIDGVQIGRVSLTAGNYGQVGALRIDAMGSTGTGEVHLDDIELYVNGSLVDKSDFEDNTLQGWSQVNTTANGSVSVVADEVSKPSDAFPLPPLSIPLSDVGMAYIPSLNKAYFGAGYTTGGGDTPSNAWFELDIATGQITQKTSMPLARWGAPVVYHPGTGKIYVFGGAVNSTTPSSTDLQIYDPATDQWTTKTMPYAIKQGAMAVYCPDDDLIHIIDSGAHYAYDPVNDQWTTKTAPPAGSRWGVLTYYDGKIYLVHGYNDALGQAEASLYAYDPATDQWTTLQGPPLANGFYGAVREFGWMNGKLYLAFYQDTPGDFFAEIYEYDPATNSWSKVGYGLIPRDGPCGYLAKDGYLYVIGGRDNHRTPIDPNDQVEKINIMKPKVLIYGPNSDTWARVNDTLEIIVLDANNNPIANTTVTVYKDGVQFATLTTDANGKATLQVTQPGKYYAEVTI